MERRNFLKRFFGGAAAVAASPLLTKGDQLAKEFHDSIPIQRPDKIYNDMVDNSGTMIVSGSYNIDWDNYMKTYDKNKFYWSMENKV